MRKRVTVEWHEFHTSTCVEGQDKVNEAIKCSDEGSGFLQSLCCFYK